MHLNNRVTRQAYLNLSAASIICMWLKIVGYMRGLSQAFATFVIMLLRILSDLREFLIVMVLFVFMFSHVFFYRLSELDDSKYLDDKHSKDTAPWYSVGFTIQTMYFGAFTGDLDLNYFLNDSDRVLLALFVFVVVIVLLNVLIAIVSDSYDQAMKVTRQLFWRARLDLVTQATTITPTGTFPEAWRPNVESVVQNELLGTEQRARTLAGHENKKLLHMVAETLKKHQEKHMSEMKRDLTMFLEHRFQEQQEQVDMQMEKIDVLQENLEEQRQDLEDDLQGMKESQEESKRNLMFIQEKQEQVKEQLKKDLEQEREKMKKDLEQERRNMDQERQQANQEYLLAHRMNDKRKMEDSEKRYNEIQQKMEKKEREYNNSLLKLKQERDNEAAQRKIERENTLRQERDRIEAEKRKEIRDKGIWCPPDMNQRCYETGASLYHSALQMMQIEGEKPSESGDSADGASETRAGAEDVHEA